MPSPKRTHGAPTSSNGASSFHLRWEVPPLPLQTVEATIEIVAPPKVPRLFFWALQVSFERKGQPRGAAHFGLQHHPAHPKSGAVNWGGYHHHSVRHGELAGGPSRLPSALGNPNTRDYPWRTGTAYRYRIAPSEPGRWRGSITDLDTGVERVVRDLQVDADSLSAPMVWSEVFADCDAPLSIVRWTNFEATLADGRTVKPNAVRVSYQSELEGGCSNTDVQRTPDGGLEQRTGVPRRTPHGARLGLTPD